MQPEFWIVAGPNGAGKTTCVQREPIRTILPPVHFVNPDNRTLEKLQAAGFQGFHDAPADVQTRLFIESADEVYADSANRLAAGESVGVETVLSSTKYCSLVRWVRQHRGTVRLIYVCLNSPDLARDRVARRVKLRGHGIPDDKVAARWRRSLQFLTWFAGQADEFWVIDNSDTNPDHGPTLAAYGNYGFIETLSDLTFPELRTALAALPRVNAN